MNKLELLKSDLKDCYDPKVLVKWPDLGSRKLKAQLKRKIRAEERRIKLGKSDD